MTPGRKKNVNFLPVSLQFIILHPKFWNWCNALLLLEIKWTRSLIHFQNIWDVLGRSCYMNAVLQAFASSISVQQWLIGNSRSPLKAGLLKCLRLLNRQEESPSEDITPSDLFIALRWFDLTFIKAKLWPFFNFVTSGRKDLS